MCAHSQRWFLGERTPPRALLRGQDGRHRRRLPARGTPSTCHCRALRSRAGPLGPLQGGWALSGPWLPWRTLEARLGRGGPRPSSSPVFGVRVSEHSCPVAPHPEGGLGGRSSCGPRWEPGQEAQRTGSWGLALPTSACGLAPGHRGEGPVFPSPCPCRPSSLPIPSAGLSWGLTFPGRCFVSRGVGSSEGESTAWLPPP